MKFTIVTKVNIYHIPTKHNTLKQKLCKITDYHYQEHLTCVYSVKYTLVFDAYDLNKNFILILRLFKNTVSTVKISWRRMRCEDDYKR
jgi:hypothetical protein